MLSLSTAASARPFTVPAKPADSWSLSVAMELVGEDIFDAMLTEVKQNIILNLGGDTGIGFMYSPPLYAIIDSLSAEGIDPHEAVYRIGDDSPDMNIYFSVLLDKGYISELPSSYTEGIAHEIRKIQYAAGLPATGELTHAIARALLNDSAVPSNEETLKILEAVSDKISEKCTREMDAAKHTNDLIDKEVSDHAVISTAALRNYTQAHQYIPSFIVRYHLYSPVIDLLTPMKDGECNEGSLNIISNSSALLYTLFYCAEHNLRHDFAGYAAEYYDLLKK